MKNFRSIICLLVTLVLGVAGCKPKEPENTGAQTSFLLTSTKATTASIFSNAGGPVREVTFDGTSEVKAEFAGTSTRLIAVAPALGITDGSAGSVRLEIPAIQYQDASGTDGEKGAYWFCKADAHLKPVPFDFSPMTGTIEIEVSGAESESLKGAILSNSNPGIAGVATLDLFKQSVIGAIPGGGSQVSVTLVKEHILKQAARLYLHVASVDCENVELRLVMASRFWRISLTQPLRCSASGTVKIAVDLAGMKVSIDGTEDTGATIEESDGGDFASLLLLDDDDNEDRIPDFSRVGYKYGDEAIPSRSVVATIDMASLSSALQKHTAKDTTDFFQQTIDKVVSNGGGAILVKNGTYNVSRILFLDGDNTVLRGESRDGTVLYSTAQINIPVVYVGATVAWTSSDQETERRTQVAGRRIDISTMKAAGNGGSSSFGSVYLVSYSPSCPGRSIGSNSVITEDYVPLGRLYVEVGNPGYFKPGDPIRIYRRGTEAWLHSIGMDRIADNGRASVGSPTNQWDVDTYTISWTRVVTAVEGNRVYLDAPVAHALDKRYGGGEIQRYTQKRVRGSGVENLTIDCRYDSNVTYNGNQVDEAHAWIGIQLKGAEHCWARNVTSRHMGYGLADFNWGARCCTVENCKSLSPVSAVQGARRYAFCFTGGSELCLVKDCYCEYDRHSFVTNGTADGPNVFTNCRSEHGFASIGPHWGYATATLYDCVEGDSNFEAQDGGNQGSGHGWRGVNTVFWNINSNGKPIVCQSTWGTCSECGKEFNRTEVCSQCGARVRPAARNYAVGCIGLKQARSLFWDRDYYGNATTDYFVDLYGYGASGENRPDGAWYPERAYQSTGGENILLPYNSPVSWWPKHTQTNYSTPRSLYQCQLEDRHARGIYLNNL